ncbi:MAG: GNAT family N-acetyltransferase [Cytophagales bacterium]|nr:GNAT family N-acetyltransferase [Cytophaga sp.]
MIHLQSPDLSETVQIELLHTMIHTFYTEYDASHTMHTANIFNTIQHFSNHPETGSVVFIMKDEIIVGYAILVNFWSNEYGGNILFIDELFIQAGYRNNGIGKEFFRLLEETYIHARVLALEVSPENAGASRLYHSLGFRKNKNSTLFNIQNR